jgi:Ca-activated chloride channel family protein
MKRVAIVVGVLVVALVGAFVVREAVHNDDEVVVVQWANSHPMRDGLLPAMAAEFNSADHKTASGRPIRVKVVACDSAVQADDLTNRVKGGAHADEGCTDEHGASADDPTIVTPQSGDWLVDINARAGRTVVDLTTTDDIADTWLGIVTYRAMAECLGWPAKDIGYADILALRASPEGWAKYPSCAQAKWGRRPLLAFTNPNTSTSGRNVLVSLYSIAAGKPPGQLTAADVERPDVVAYVKQFQQLVDHYMPGTIPLNTKIVQGPRYGQFFLMPEDNLVNLAKGHEKAIANDGTEQAVPPVKDLVMIYPKEGSVRNGNPAGIVRAPWVSADEADAAHEWIDYVRADGQQRKFVAAGFRPARGSGVDVDERRFERWGLDARGPRATIEPSELAPDVLAKVVGSWGSVKKPSIVTFVVDVSASMAGKKLDQVKQGMGLVLDAMSKEKTDNQVGLVTFASQIETEIPPVSLSTGKYQIADAVDAMRPRDSTALYDAIARAITLTDAAPGDPDATRAVVVLSDGQANSGHVDLSQIVQMESRAEVVVSDFTGTTGAVAHDVDGKVVPASQLVGTSLRFPHAHPVQLFFVGFGDADIDVGRILAQATGAEYAASTEDDLANVINELSGYF